MLRRLEPGAALLPLRLFLGGTFVYAGIQKLSDPGFLHPGAPTYIGTQLHGFADGTAGGLNLPHPALPHPQPPRIRVALPPIPLGPLHPPRLRPPPAAAAGVPRHLPLLL